MGEIYELRRATRMTTAEFGQTPEHSVHPDSGHSLGQGEELKAEMGGRGVPSGGVDHGQCIAAPSKTAEANISQAPAAASLAAVSDDGRKSAIQSLESLLNYKCKNTPSGAAEDAAPQQRMSQG